MALPLDQHHPYEIKITSIKVDCYRCGGQVCVEVEKGNKPPPKLCTKCKVIPEEGYGHGDLIWFDSWKGRIPAKKPELLGVTIYRPGDEGFEERAAEITPPRCGKVARDQIT